MAWSDEARAAAAATRKAKAKHPAKGAAVAASIKVQITRPIKVSGPLILRSAGSTTSQASATKRYEARKGRSLTKPSIMKSAAYGRGRK